MKIIIQNPHIFADAPIQGIHDYLVYFLNTYRPTIQLVPYSLINIKRWFGYLKRKNLPIIGWKYICSEKSMNSYDVWICFNGTSKILSHPVPKKFQGLKIYHIMDYVFDADASSQALERAGIDFLLGYSSHDLWCPFFKQYYKYFLNRVVPFPFGYSKRFKNIVPFELREKKASIMGAVNKVNHTGLENRVKEYSQFFKDIEWEYPIRQAVRENLSNLDNLIVSYLAPIGQRVNLSYDSPEELNRFQLFINDDNIKHFPPSRTYEGTACGAVMVCSEHPCFEEFGWKKDLNCFCHPFADFEKMKETVKTALMNQDRLKEVQHLSVKNAQRFSHPILSDYLYQVIQHLYYGKDIENLRNHFRLT